MSNNSVWNSYVDNPEQLPISFANPSNHVTDSYFCNKCGNPGHNMDKCPLFLPISSENSKEMNMVYSSNQQQIFNLLNSALQKICANCNSQDHNTMNCPSSRNTTLAYGVTPIRVGAAHAVDLTGVESNPNDIPMDPRLRDKDPRLAYQAQKKVVVDLGATEKKKLSDTQFMKAKDLVLKDEVDPLRELIKANHDLIRFYQKDGTTLLHIAAEKGSIQSLKYLCRQGACIDVQKRLGMLHTPLFLAASQGHVNIVDYLIQQKANITIKGALKLETEVELLTPKEAAAKLKYVHIVNQIEKWEEEEKEKALKPKERELRKKYEEEKEEMKTKISHQVKKNGKRIANLIY